ncbi:MAG TPA: aldehyde dehydrogenase family protein [Bryobacteraceae bacterium]
MSPATSAKLLDSTVWEKRYFDGAWKAAPAAINVREPATGASLGTAGGGTAELATELTNRAAEAQPKWGEASNEDRARIIREAARIIEANAPEIAEWIIRETGGVRPKADFEIAIAVGELHHSAALLTQPIGQILPSPDPERMSLARRVPVGVVSVITPWNVPLVLAMRSVAPALALGNAVVLKPDPQTPVCGGYLLARVFEQAGLPAGLLSVVPGGADVGEALVTAPAVRLVTFTGSSAVGRRVGELAGRGLKKVSLELGGNSPMIVLDDCDLDAASSAGAWGSFLHQGQICMATSRHIVLRKVAGAYVEKLAARAAALPVGDPFREQVAIGPLISEKQLNRVDGIVKDSVSAGAKLVTGGTHAGLFYKPTVLADVGTETRAFQDEIFGPVAPVTIAEDDEHAIALANSTGYGLAAAVQTGSVDRGFRIARRLRSGMVHVNDQTVADHPGIPMGGMGQSGNGTRFGSTTNLDEFTEWQWLTLGARPVRYPF